MIERWPGSSRTGSEIHIAESEAREYELMPVDYPYGNVDAVRLIGDLDKELSRLYGSSDAECVPVDSYARPQGIFLVGYENALAVACGGLRLRYDLSEECLTAEIKRLYVKHENRRQGWATVILGGLIDWARSADVFRVVLETGTESSASLALYAAMGFRQIEQYPSVYAGSPTNLSFEKTIRQSS